MYNLVKPISIRQELLDKKIRVFSNNEFSFMFKLSPYQSEYMLSELVKEGLLNRLKRGVYFLKTDPPNENEIANVLYQPSYISFDYALAYYNLIPEAVYEITSATTKPTRLFTTNNLAFGYYTIKNEAYTGYYLKQETGRKFLIAEPEKAVVDYLYALTLGKRGLLGDRTINDRLKGVKKLNKDKIFYYAKLFNWTSLDKLLAERWEDLQ